MCEVVTARKQFAPSLVSPNTRLRNVEAWSQAVTIAIESERNWALPAGERTEIVPGASHFLAHDIASPSWRNAYQVAPIGGPTQSEEHTSELQALMRISYSVFCLKKKNKTTKHIKTTYN